MGLMHSTTTPPAATSDLFAAAHSALTGKRWSEARRHLDDLGRRSDNRDLLASVEAYGVPEMLLAVIGDRIELVNSKAR